MSEFPFLRSKISVQGRLVLRTGLHIGGGDVGLAIGGIDKSVVRSPKGGAPYVPGSSLKGKVRSLLERAGYAKGFPESVGPGKACECARADCLVCVIFGVSADQKNKAARDCGTTRLIVRDGRLVNEDEVRSWRYLYTDYTETKTEVSIDRLTSQANPRTFERVPAGAVFELDVVLNIHEGDDEKKLLALLFDGFELLSLDYLGGQGSRGYGAIRIHIEEVKKLDVESLKNEKAAWVPIGVHGRTLPWVSPKEG